MKVYNKRTDIVPPNAVYIGRYSRRQSLCGNPFSIGRDGTREDVLDMYRGYVEAQPDMIRRIKQKLRGKDLVCFCKPLACHGDILLRIANE